ncbi:MAG: DUF3040 domain-containing protein [Terracidiphilus sp.]
MWRRCGAANLAECLVRPGLLEVADVSLSGREQRTLRHIAGQLAASDPELASILGVFNRLEWDEAMPARQPPAARSADLVRAWSRRLRLAVSRFGPRRHGIRRQRRGEHVQQE